MCRWDRITIKTKGKMAMRKNYWSCVLTSLILSLFLGGFSVQLNLGQDHLKAIHVTAWMLGLLAGVVCLEMLLRIFVFSPLEVGGCRFFVQNAYSNPSAGTLLMPFNSGHYGKIVLTLFLRDLYIVLWTCLFVIPGIIKGFEYMMVPYILAEHPELSRREVFAESRRMMRGQKFDAFILELSFIGWALVSVCTMGIAGIFFVEPYMNATMAELFLALSRDPEQDQYYHQDQYWNREQEQYQNQGQYWNQE